MSRLSALLRIAGAAVLALAIPGVAHAQLASPIEFTTTFPFTVGMANLPAGTYRLQVDDDDPTMAEITGPHVGAFFAIVNAEETAPTKSEVVFTKYGDAYVLKHVWVAGSEDGIEVAPAEPEKHHAKLHQASGEQRVPAKRAKSS
jgi:hypothetical protein